jgi:hypothetical protein
MKAYAYGFILALSASAGLWSCAPTPEGEGCTQLEGFPEEVVTVRQGMTIDQVTGCSLAAVRGLDAQIIDEMNCLVEDALVNFEDLNVSLQGTSPWALLQPQAKEGLRRAIQSRGRRFDVNSIYRTIAQQYLLYQWYQRGQCGIGIAAQPGRSNHQSGLAVDISDYTGWRSHLEGNGWDWYGSGDVVHFDYEGGGTRDIRGTAIMAFQRLWNRNNPNDRISEDGAYGPQTEARLKRAPLTGFATGANCAPDPDPDPEPMPTDAEMSVSIGIETIEGQDRDLLPEGSSAEVFDLLEGQRTALTFTVRNGAGRPVTDDVIIGYQLDSPWLTAPSWQLQSDFPARDGRTWQRNDATDHPNNPERLGDGGLLHLYPLSPGESKRLRMELEGGAYNPEGVKPRVRLWVKHVAEYYGEGDGWDDAVEVNMAPEVLRREATLDVLSRDYWAWGGPDERDVEGWSACGDAGLRVQGGALLIEGGQDSCVEGPAWTRIDAESYKALLIRARHDAAGQSGRVAWRCPDSGAYDPSCEARFMVPGDGQWADAVVDLAASPTWRGDILGLRIFPVDARSPGAQIALDAVEPRAEGLPDDNNGDPNNGDPNNGVEPDNNGEPVNNGVEPGNNGGPNNGGEPGNNGDPDPLDPDAGGPRTDLQPKSRGTGCATAPGAPGSGLGGLVWLLLGLLGVRRAAQHHP